MTAGSAKRGRAVPEAAAQSASFRAALAQGFVGVTVELDAAVKAAQARGDHAAHAALTELHNAAGLLKAKAATRVTELSGADRALAEKVHALL